MKFFLLLYAFFELFFIILAIKTLGFGIYALEVLLSGAVGMAVLFKFGVFKFMDNMRENGGFFGYSGGIFSYLLGEFGLAFGAVALILPGILSDFIGIILIIFSIFWRENNQNKAKFYSEKNRQNKDESDIIDVEIIEDK